LSEDGWHLTEISASAPLQEVDSCIPRPCFPIQIVKARPNHPGCFLNGCIRGRPNDQIASLPWKQGHAGRDKSTSAAQILRLSLDEPPRASDRDGIPNVESLLAASLQSVGMGLCHGVLASFNGLKHYALCVCYQFANHIPEEAHPNVRDSRWGEDVPAEPAFWYGRD
jgi:hypothetical protein